MFTGISSGWVMAEITSGRIALEYARFRLGEIGNASLASHKTFKPCHDKE
jgi:hypothetical protein